MIKIVEGRDLIYDVKDYDLVLVGTSIMNSLGNGFQYKVGLNFPNVLDAAKTATKYGDITKLGKVSIIEGTPSFALCYITKGRYRPDIHPDALEYEALEKCLNTVKRHYGNLKIACPVLGYSIYEGGGIKGKIIKLFNDILGDCDVTVYDYEQKDITTEKKEAWGKVVESVGTPDYEQAKKSYFWTWGVGIYEPMPDGVDVKTLKEMIANRKKKNLQV